MEQWTQPPTDHDRLADEIDRLVEECRADHLWYQRVDYFPRTDAERLQVLEAIQRRANLAVFRRAGALKAWLSRLSSGESAGS